MLLEGPQRHYRGEAGRHYQQNKRGVPENALAWVTRARAEKFSRFIAAGDALLEYGAGAGWNLAQLKCRRRLAFDLEDHLPASIRESVEFIASTQSVPDNAMDVVLCHHALEHILNPPAALEEMRRMLRPQGKLLLFVPHEREMRYWRFERGEPNHHLYSWNAQTLGNLVEESGFEVIEAGIGQFGYDRFAAVWADKLRAGETGFRLLRATLRRLKPVFEVRVVANKK
jgi:SAM-dependent methyltransferase